MNKERGKNQPHPQGLTRKDFLRLGGAVLGGYLLSRCAPAPTVTSESTLLFPTDTLVPPTSTQTRVPLTSTPRPTATEKPTQTPTQTPTPKIDVLKLLEEAGIEFPEIFETHLVREYGEFNFRLSQKLFGEFRLSRVQLPDVISEIMYLNAMGLYMYTARDLDMEKYAEFFNLANEIKESNTSDPSSMYRDWPEFRNLAQQVLDKYGKVPLDFDERWKRIPCVGEGCESRIVDSPEVRFVNNLNMNFVTHEEFKKSTKALSNNGIKFFLSSFKTNYPIDWFDETAVFINGDSIELIAYNKGNEDIPQKLYPGSSFIRYGGAPPERLSAGMEKEWYYYSLWTLYRDAIISSQLNLSPTGNPDRIKKNRNALI
jgi:hypothetical protein